MKNSFRRKHESLDRPGWLSGERSGHFVSLCRPTQARRRLPGLPSSLAGRPTSEPSLSPSSSGVRASSFQKFVRFRCPEAVGCPALSRLFQALLGQLGQVLLWCKEGQSGREKDSGELRGEEGAVCLAPPLLSLLPPWEQDPSSPLPRSPSRALGPRLSDELHPLCVSLQTVPGEM